MRTVNMVGVLDAPSLMRLHEWLPIQECYRCAGTGFDITITTVMGIGFIGVSDDPCECCSGLGFHFDLIRN